MSVSRRARATASALAAALTLSGVGLLPGVSIDDRPAQAAVPATFVAQGPAPIRGGQVENQAPNNAVAGAVHTVVAHPGDADTLWVGTVNGGIWRTRNATATSPTWAPLTDEQQSLSIGAMELDPTVATNTVLVAGHGNFSSFFGIGGPLVGLLRSTNAGNTWTPLAGTGLVGENVSGVAPRGNVIVVAANGNTAFGAPGQGGIFRSTNTGATFTRRSGATGSGLPGTGVFDLVGDPSNPARLYAGTPGGIFRSDDTGLTWTNVTSNVAGVGGTTNNLELAVHTNGAANAVYAGVINSGQLNGLWRSANQGGTWTRLDTPVTNEGGTIVGLQPRVKPGQQGSLHFSIGADPTNANLVYVGGDRQPNPFTNSIGATDFVGRLFKCDASLAAGAQCSALTHNGTAANSAPHADSREMVFDRNGDLIETDDGGVTRQTDPSTTNGDWFSLNGNLQIAEHLSCDYDSVGNIILCGNQDTGVPEQSAAGSTAWDTVSSGDGGFVAVDDSGASSIRYSSSNNLSTFGFGRRTCTAANTCVNSLPGFNVTGVGQTIQNFEVAGANSTLPLYTPLVLNEVAPARLVVTSNTRVYESTDRLDNLAIVATPGVGTGRAIAYGGRQGGTDNPDVLWYGAGNGLFLRTAAVGAPAALPGWTNGVATDIELDPQDWATAFVATPSAIFRSADAGLSFTDISASLNTLTGNAPIYSLEVVPVPAQNTLVLLAGTRSGLYMTNTQSLGSWTELGPQLPNTNVRALRYDAADDVLLVGTAGRGSWLLPNVQNTLPVANLRVFKEDSPDPVKAGEELFYTVTVTNGGPDGAFDVVVTDDLPAEVVHLSDTGNCTLSPGPNRLTCPLGDIPTFTSRTFTIKTRVRANAVVNENDGTLLIQNQVTVGSAAIDDDLTDNTAVEPTFVQEGADLAVTKVCKPDDELRAGETGTCTIFVDNHGPSDARDVILRDIHLSDGPFTLGPVTTTQGACSVAAQTVNCNLGDIAAASTTQPGRARVTVALTAAADVDINDVADVRSPTPDPNPTDNQAQGTVNVMAVADLSITKTGPATVVPGTDFAYDLTITNGGPSPAEGVVVEDVLSAGVEIVSVTGSGGATCNAGVPGDSLLPTRCSFGVLANGASRTMHIVARARPDARGVVHNDARVSSDTFDDDLSDNLATTAAATTPSADLRIEKADSPDPVLAGNQLSYTITVTNDGPSTADDVRVSDTLPAGTTFVSAVDGTGAVACALAQPGAILCTLGTMTPAQRAVLVVTVAVAASLPDGTVLVNSATVTSAPATPDPDLTDNTATATTTVATAADLWLDKTAEVKWKRRPGKGKPRVVFTLTVHNRAGCETDAYSGDTPSCGAGGPSDAVDVEVQDELPLDDDKVDVKFVSPECDYDEDDHTVTCEADRIPAGASVTFVIEAEVSRRVKHLENSAEVESATFDPVAGNNENDVEVNLDYSSGLSLPAAQLLGF